MKIAITGGAGFIGTHLTKAYLDAGHDVLVLDNLLSGSHQSVDPRARFYHVDVRDSKLQTILQHEHPEVVSYHVALPQANLPHSVTLSDADIHVRGLLNLLDSCVNASVSKFIFASSGNSLYQSADTRQIQVTEETPLHPDTSTDINKLAGEWYVRYYTQQHGLKHTILRYADVYGEINQTDPILLHHPLSYFIYMLAQQRRPIIHGTGDQIRDHIFIDDVVQANLSALKRGHNQTFHISSGHGYSLNQLYQLVARHMDSKLEPVYLSGSLTGTSVIMDNTRAMMALAWKPEVSLSEGIRRAIVRLRGTEEEPTPRYVPVSVDVASIASLANAASLTA
ncbi:NAD-dependent epimerase/dehydratase family protein [Ktedonosporobacter rubrisoli]|uniref:NAD-dependent epimerase/dehydratase family protein n=1 Tax=Ktedonosporobacter rubrisoli TaxID=2509675 RepID=A0A4P6K398_KTERU|nr:NAD-dependent epimerase/dehydratase family protein [Ktedonosporobacter rubrisoli]QBD81956.1 NAD-dependent epimerase/dehydratase family protein [Ktedonosporobacter rubrisoli]